MGQGTETCADRPTEVSVIRFVSRNRTIEEIAPKKEVYTCKQRGCGKIFTSQDEFKTHEAFEALKIRFVCREAGCGEELSDPGSMWRHYQEWHNGETNVFACPYTSCNSVHTTSDNLEEHIASRHRQLPNLPTEPEVICFEGSDRVIEEQVLSKKDGRCECEDKSCERKREGLRAESKDVAVSSESVAQKTNDYTDDDDDDEDEDDDDESEKCERINGENRRGENLARERKETNVDPGKEEGRARKGELLNEVATKFPKNKDLSITKENFLIQYEARSSMVTDASQIERSRDNGNVVFVSRDITITKNMKNDISTVTRHGQEHRIDLGNLETVFRSGLERDSPKLDNNAVETNSNCSEDEEYTPKKQRMSRYKQESYKCETTGCGKTYKYISHYRHHRDSHKLTANATNSNSTKSAKPKQGKASTVSFFLHGEINFPALLKVARGRQCSPISACKMPGCGAEVDNVTGLWKHYRDNHANSKPLVLQTARSSEIFRCKVRGCELEFSTTLMLYKHFNQVHSNGATVNVGANTKTGNGGSFRFADRMFQDDATTRRENFKTDFKANHKTNSKDNSEKNRDHTLSLIIKEESRD